MDAATPTPSISYYKGGVLSQPETFFMSYQILSFLLDFFHREFIFLPGYFYLLVCEINCVICRGRSFGLQIKVVY